MNSISARLSGIAAILFTILVVVGGGLAFDQPDNDAPDQEWIDYVNDDGKLVSNLVGGYILVVAGLLFLVFAVAMYRRLRSAERGDGSWSMVMLVSAVSFAVCLMAGAVMAIVIAGGTKLGSATPATPETSRWLPQIGFGVILVAGGLSAALSMGVMNTLILQTKVLPAWIAYLGYLAAIALLAAATFIPMIVFLVYMLVLGVVLLMRGDDQPAMAA